MKRKHLHKKHVRPAISLGVELETYSIACPDYRICRELHFPKRSTIEKGERFTRDVSIGSEYNSKVFSTIREAFFLLKNGLRKYTEFANPQNGNQKTKYVILPVGGWIDRFAGAHIHLATGKKKFRYEDAKTLSLHLHDHIPFLIALTANSPIWRESFADAASNRLKRGSQKYCQVTKSGILYKQKYREITFNRGGKKKPPTLEIRVCDSSIPEYLAAALVICLAPAMRWRLRKAPLNRSTHPNYLKSREQAIRYGVKSRLVWANHWMRLPSYIDIFFRKYHEELQKMDIPDEVIRVFKCLKKGWNQSELIRRSAENCRKKHRPTWQRQFARRYAIAIEELLDGNSFENFAKRLGVKLPNIKRTWLGRRDSKW